MKKILILLLIFNLIPVYSFANEYTKMSCEYKRKVTFFSKDGKKLKEPKSFYAYSDLIYYIDDLNKKIYTEEGVAFDNYLVNKKEIKITQDLGNILWKLSVDRYSGKLKLYYFVNILDADVENVGKGKCKFEKTDLVKFK